MSIHRLPKVLVVDDDPGVCEALQLALETSYSVHTCGSVEEAMERLRSDAYEVVLCDLTLPGLSGEALLLMVKETWPSTEVVMISAARDAEMAVRCMKVGAYDYIVKPWDLQQLSMAVARAVEKSRLSRENLLLRQGTGAVRAAQSLLGSSPAMQALRERIARVAASDVDVLIQGESGTGKELVARALHELGPRHQERFVAIGCGSIPADLVESELFGHEKGAFSSAHSSRIGKFEYASGGTLFLDDVAVLPMGAQAKLLRVLQEREICRLGSNRMIPVDVRVISSSNVDLYELAKQGQFREDLYWRLSGVPVPVPPLRERGEDREELFLHFLEELAVKQQRPRPRVPEPVWQALRAHSFPGNVRELRRLAETLLVLSEGESLQASALPAQMLLQADRSAADAGTYTLKHAVRDLEKQMIVQMLQQTQGNQSKAAEALGIHRNTLLVKMNELGIQRLPAGLP